jgi:hypothetical protein
MKNKTHREAVIIILENLFFMILKKVGLAAIKSFMIGISFKSYLHVQSESIQIRKIKASNFSNQALLRMLLMP